MKQKRFYPQKVKRLWAVMDRASGEEYAGRWNVRRDAQQKADELNERQRQADERSAQFAALERKEVINESKPKPKYKGNWLDRLKAEQGNPREVAFADEWIEQNRSFTNAACETATLGVLLSSSRDGYWTECSERDEMVAATIIQWLGSNVGFSFMEQALGRCGLKIVKRHQKMEAS
jgi:hypothetical protein